MRAKEGKTFTIIDHFQRSLIVHHNINQYHRSRLSTIYGTSTCTTVVINTTYDNTCRRKRRRTFSDAKLSCAHTCTSKNATIIQGYTNN